MTQDDISKDALQAVFSATKTLPATLSRSEEVMGVTGTITLVGANAHVMDQCWELAHRCEQLWSRFLPSSDISRLNMAEGQVVTVDPLTISLIEEMVKSYELTQGSFNPTVLKGVISAGYAASLTDPSKKTELPASALPQGNLTGVVIDGLSVRLPVGTVLDGGGIGKGFAADLITQRALELGAWGAMAEFGGDVVVAGNPPNGKAWRLGVEDPFDSAEYIDVVRLLAGGVATSSQRKRRFGAEHHLINPDRHLSAESSIQTVTVIAASGARAEVLTKRGFMIPIEHYLAWLPEVGAAGLAIDAQGRSYMSENWVKYR